MTTIDYVGTPSRPALQKTALDPLTYGREMIKTGLKMFLRYSVS